MRRRSRRTARFTPARTGTRVTRIGSDVTTHRQADATKHRDPRTVCSRREQRVGRRRPFQAATVSWRAEPALQAIRAREEACPPQVPGATDVHWCRTRAARGALPSTNERSSPACAPCCPLTRGDMIMSNHLDHGPCRLDSRSWTSGSRSLRLWSCALLRNQAFIRGFPDHLAKDL